MLGTERLCRLKYIESFLGSGGVRRNCFDEGNGRVLSRRVKIQTPPLQQVAGGGQSQTGPELVLGRNGCTELQQSRGVSQFLIP